MRTLTAQEKRTVRLGTIGVAVYLLLFGGFKVWQLLASQRTEYRKLVMQAKGLEQQVRVYEGKILVVKKLMEEFHMDPAKLTKKTGMAEASSAIQRSAMTGGVMLGPVRESPARPSSKELGSMQLEGAGPVTAVMGWLYRLQSVGHPLIVDSIQISSEPTRPGQMKVNLTILVLDFEQWGKEGPNA